MKEKPNVPINCFFQGCYNPAYEEEICKAKEKCKTSYPIHPSIKDRF